MCSWPVPVAIITDESISSWLIRCALENGCDPLVLTGVVWPGWRVWTSDADRGIPLERLDAVADLSGVEKRLLKLAAISREVELLGPGALPKYGLWPWTLGLGARNRRYRGGVQYCPGCFDQDLKPYLRRHWRFSWNTVCPLHNVRLIDSCPRCRKPLEPHRLEAVHSSKLSTCASCRCHLQDYSGEKPIPNAQSFQRRADLVISGATVEIGQTMVSPSEWFEACRHLMGLIRRSATFPESSVARALVDAGVDLHALVPEALHLQLELLPVVAREPLLACLEQLLCNLELFANCLKERDVSANSIWGRNKYLPPSLRFLSEQLRRAPRAQKPRGGSKRSKPKSVAAVRKSWARLKRKYGID